MYSDDQLTIRPATADDKGFIVSLTPRLVEFNPPTWRDKAQLTATDIAVLTDALTNPQPDSAIYIAQTNSEQPVGFIHLRTAVDYYTQQQHGHIADLVVAPIASRKGVGQALI